MSKSMLTPEQQIRQRYAWFEAAERLGNVTLACERGGISRKTYYKWRRRFAEARGDRQAQVGEALPDDRRALDDGDDSHRSATLGTEERIHLVDLADEAGPCYCADSMPGSPLYSGASDDFPSGGRAVSAGAGGRFQSSVYALCESRPGLRNGEKTPVLAADEDAGGEQGGGVAGVHHLDRPAGGEFVAAARGGALYDDVRRLRVHQRHGVGAGREWGTAWHRGVERT